MRLLLVPTLLAGLLGSGPATAAEATFHQLPVPPLDRREIHLADLVQLTRRGENAEAYWSPDGTEVMMQSTRPPYACDQIFRQRADGTGTPILVSTGKGRTTCSYFTADAKRVLFSSTHAASPDCPPVPDHSHGYVWAVY
ncbi:MAG TPA: hypothetical protein VLX28_12000, partial [Thermoanaerobaculia bacterium]|nr:hypothetical protein [Thermoanaerobaculia bacterium]